MSIKMGKGETSFPGRAKGEKKVNIKDEIEEAGSLEETREKQREKLREELEECTCLQSQGKSFRKKAVTKRDKCCCC